jgi:8-oxo-dGTP diphosphatase
MLLKKSLQYGKINYQKKRNFMKNTTLCYIEHNGKYLMLHRTKKKNDENVDKWIGVGGKFEAGESPFDCARREIKEETGLDGIPLSYRGIVTFVSNEYGTEYMHLFTATAKSDKIDVICDEGELVWIEKSKVSNLPIWEGDKIFLRLLDERRDFFSLKLTYSGEQLCSYVIE